MDGINLLFNQSKHPSQEFPKLQIHNGKVFLIAKRFVVKSIAWSRTPLYKIFYEQTKGSIIPTSTKGKHFMSHVTQLNVTVFAGPHHANRGLSENSTFQPLTQTNPTITTYLSDEEEEEGGRFKIYRSTQLSKTGEGVSGHLDISELKDEDMYLTPQVRIEEDESVPVATSPYILTKEQMHQVAKHVLPKTISFCRWRRLYGLGRDGDSFKSPTSV